MQVQLFKIQSSPPDHEPELAVFSVSDCAELQWHSFVLFFDSIKNFFSQFYTYVILGQTWIYLHGLRSL